MKPNMEKVIIPDSTSVYGLFYFMYMEYRDEMIQDAQKQVTENVKNAGGNVVAAPEKVFQKGAGMYVHTMYEEAIVKHCGWENDDACKIHNDRSSAHWR